ncbi:hypothetical protein PGB90_009602 [Kerria lacca]
MYDENNEKSAHEFLHFYHKFKFQEIISGEEISVSQAKRMQLILAALESNKLLDRVASHFVLKKNLDEYCTLIDNRNGLNNHANYIKILCSKLSKPITECDKWKSNLKNSKDINSVVQNLKLDSKTADEEKIDDCLLHDMLFKQKQYEKEKNCILKYPKNDCKQSTFISLLSAENVPQVTKNNESPSASFSSNVNNQSSTFHSIKRPCFLKSYHRENISNENCLSKSSEEEETACSNFRTAKTELKLQNLKKYGHAEKETSLSKENVATKRFLGTRPKSVNKKFTLPIKNNDSLRENYHNNYNDDYNNEEDGRLKNLDPKMIELIKNEIMDHSSPVTWDDIAGLEFAKKTIQEIVVWPILRPDIFTGLRRPPKGILLFGPPGTGKTLIGKCIASQSSSTFFSISASSLTSKWIGESEKLVRTLFAVARCQQPAVIFIDEIDSLLSQRSETEHESSRRIKTEFLVQLVIILVIGATNRPQELDEAARRRLVKRLYIPLPDFEARCQIVQRLMKTEKNNLTEDNINEIAKLTEGYSGADVKNLCQEASLGPIRSIDFHLIGSIESQQVRPVSLVDFNSALKVVRCSVSSSDLNQYLEWNKLYGSTGN